ncbi:MAG: multiprotein bridging factor aMBF1 [Candidatus Hodarchaeota archaeon]
MSKKGTGNYSRECPICGGIIWGKGQYVLLEGAKIVVCQSCAQHGTKIYERPKPPQQKKLNYSQTISASKKSKPKQDSFDNVEIVPDYAKRIRNTRNSRNLNQEQFAQKLNEKPSLLRRIEAGKVEPTIKLAQKIEQTYHIKLLKKVDDIEASLNGSKYIKKSGGSSLGDIAFIKKKK